MRQRVVQLASMLACLVGAGSATAQEASAPVTAFVHVAVIPMDRDRVLADHTVLVRGDRIVALGPTDQVTIPAGAVQVDGRGKYLLPGLADMHVHLRDENDASLLLFVANGVTTVRDMHSGNRQDIGMIGSDSIRFALRRRVAAGELVGPRIYTAGDPEDTSPTAAAQSVAALKADGHDFVKVSGVSSETYDSIKVAAARAGIRLVGHVPNDRPLDVILRDQWASIEHLMGYYQYLLGYNTDGIFGQFGQLADIIDTVSWMQPAMPSPEKLQAIAAATQQAGVWNCPTVKQWLVFKPDSAVPEGSDLTAEQETRRRTMSRVGKRLQTFSYQVIKALQSAGAGVLAGTDVGDYSLTDVPPGFGLVTELQELVHAGLTPYQALETSTRNVATFLGTLDSTGTIAVGKRADLVLLNDTPLRDIRAVAGPAGVMVGGQWLPRAELDRRLDSVQTWRGFDLTEVRQTMWHRKAP